MNFDEIKARAFANWLARGRPEGTPEVDWITAVVELSMEGDAKVDADLQKAITELMAQLKTGTTVGTPPSDLQAQLDKAKKDLADAQKALADEKAKEEAEEKDEVDLTSKLDAALKALKEAQQAAIDAKTAADKATADAKAAADEALAKVQKSLDETLAALAALKGQPPTPTPTPTPGALTITAKSPEDKATNVALDAKVSATFSQAVNSDTVTTTTFRMRAQGQAADVPAKVEPDAAHLVFTLTPNAPTLPGIVYTVTIDGTVKDATPQGVALGAPVTWSFTTAGAAAPPGPPTPAPAGGAPVIVSLTPANGTTGIALNAKVVVTFNKPMLVATLTKDTIKLRANGSQTDVPATVEVDSTGTIATLTPDKPTAANTTYIVTVSGRVSDASNAAMGNDQSSSFTTGAA